MCCKDPNFRPPSPKSNPVSNSSSNRNLMNTNTKNLCPSGYSGLRPVPYDCTKFANCWKGRAIIQSCGPGNVDFTEKIKLLNFYFIFKKILVFFREICQVPISMLVIQYAIGRAKQIANLNSQELLLEYLLPMRKGRMIMLLMLMMETMTHQI